MANGDAYPRVPVSALVIFTLPHVPENWVTASNDPKTEAARIYYAAIDAARNGRRRRYKMLRGARA